PGRLLDVRGAVLGDGMGDTVPVPAAVPGRPALGGQAQAPSPPGGRRGTARSPTVVPRRALAEADPGPAAGRPQALSRRVIPAGRSPLERRHFIVLVYNCGDDWLRTPERRAFMIKDVRTKPLRVIPDERGRLMETLRSDDDLFIKFGQA